MRDPRNSPRHRLIQVFVSEHGVFETYIKLAKENTFACTCPGFRARHWCKHCAFVTDRASESGYALELLADAQPLTDAIADDAAAFRDWVIRNTKVEAL